MSPKLNTSKPERWATGKRIRAYMTLAGVTDEQIALQERCTPNYVQMVVFGQRKGFRIRAAIARALKKGVDDLWRCPRMKNAA